VVVCEWFDQAVRDEAIEGAIALDGARPHDVEGAPAYGAVRISQHRHDQAAHLPVCTGE
jgi:hypothetical protein